MLIENEMRRLWFSFISLMLVFLFVSYVFHNSLFKIEKKPLPKREEGHATTTNTSNQMEGPHNAILSWEPHKFHPNTENWKDCVSFPFKDFPSIESFAKRPVVIYLWHPLREFYWVHKVK